MQKPEITKISIYYCQNGNTIGTTNDLESIIIDAEFQATEKDGAFYVLTTDGWSIDDPSEIKELIDPINQLLENRKQT